MKPYKPRKIRKSDIGKYVIFKPNHFWAHLPRVFDKYLMRKILEINKDGIIQVSMEGQSKAHYNVQHNEIYDIVTREDNPEYFI